MLIAQKRAFGNICPQDNYLYATSFFFVLE